MDHRHPHQMAAAAEFAEKSCFLQREQPRHHSRILPQLIQYLYNLLLNLYYRLNRL